MCLKHYESWNEGYWKIQVTHTIPPKKICFVHYGIYWSRIAIDTFLFSLMYKILFTSTPIIIMMVYLCIHCGSHVLLGLFISTCVFLSLLLSLIVHFYFLQLIYVFLLLLLSLIVYFSELGITICFLKDSNPYSAVGIAGN